MKRSSKGPGSFKPIRAHTGAFRHMQMLVRLAKLKESDPKLYDRVMEEQIGGRDIEIDESRRSFLRGAAGAAVGAMSFEALSGFRNKAYGAMPQSFEVAIVGAGVAGLNCAWNLRKFIRPLANAGINLNVTIYEGRPNRTGGRMLTSTDDVVPNMRCELGAEFVDSTNDDIFRLAQDPELGAVCQREFGHPLAMIDTGQDHVTNKLIPQTLFIQGKQHKLEEALEKLSTFVKEMAEQPNDEINQTCANFKLHSSRDRLTKKALTSCGGTGHLGFNDFGQPSGAADNALITKFDKMTTEQYINSLPITREDDWVRGYLNTAYTTEYGMGLDEQSSLGMITLFGDQEDDKPKKKQPKGRGTSGAGSQPATSIDVFGPSDERFKVLGGNDKIVRCLTIALQTLAPKPTPIHLDSRLTRITRGKNGTDNRYTLSFEDRNGQPRRDVIADLVVLACPFTGLSTIKKPEAQDDFLKFPRFARLHPQHPLHQNFSLPADLSSLGIQREKANAIDNVGYGRNFKMMAGLDRQVWREQKDESGQPTPFGGYTFTDGPFQMGWDSGECQNLDTIPTAIQTQVNASTPGVMPKMRVEKKNFSSVPNGSYVMRNSQVLRQFGVRSARADGAQFSWFMGGNSLSEQLLKDPALRNFVSHTAGNGVPGEGQNPGLLKRDARGNVVNQDDGRGVTPTQISRILQYSQALVDGVDKVYKGFGDSYKRQSAKMGRWASTSYIWTNDHFTRGSYLAYLPGQWTTISGVEGAPLTMDGRLVNFTEASKWTMFFAGEHTSGDFQGFMNGGAQTGRLAAQRILIKFLGLEAARLVMPFEMANLFEPSRRSFFVRGFDQFFG